MLWLGNISFGLFIIHVPVLRIFNSVSEQVGIAHLTSIHFILFTTILILLSHLANVLCNRLRLSMEKYLIS